MNGNHVTGGAVGLLVGYIAAHFGWNVSRDEALAWGALFAGIFGVIAHLAAGPGIWPGLKRALLGDPKAK